jgi:hypothetical protein
MDQGVYQMFDCGTQGWGLKGFHVQETGDPDGSFYLYQQLKPSYDPTKERIYIGFSSSGNLSVTDTKNGTSINNDAYKMIYLPCGLIVSTDYKKYLSYIYEPSYNGSMVETQAVPSSGTIDDNIR